MLFRPIYPLVNVNKKLLKMAIEIVDFPIKNGDFPIKNGDFPIKNGDVPLLCKRSPEGSYRKSPAWAQTASAGRRKRILRIVQMRGSPGKYGRPTLRSHVVYPLVMSTVCY